MSKMKLYKSHTSHQALKGEAHIYTVCALGLNGLKPRIVEIKYHFAYFIKYNKDFFFKSLSVKQQDNTKS